MTPHLMPKVIIDTDPFTPWISAMVHTLKWNYVDACIRNVHSSERTDNGKKKDDDPNPTEDDGDPLDTALHATDVRVRGQVMVLNGLHPYFL